LHPISPEPALCIVCLHVAPELPSSLSAPFLPDYPVVFPPARLGNNFSTLRPDDYSSGGVGLRRFLGFRCVSPKGVLLPYFRRLIYSGCMPLVAGLFFWLPFPLETPFPSLVTIDTMCHPTAFSRALCGFASLPPPGIPSLCRSAAAWPIPLILNLAPPSGCSSTARTLVFLVRVPTRFVGSIAPRALERCSWTFLELCSLRRFG